MSDHFYDYHDFPFGLQQEYQPEMSRQKSPNRGGRSPQRGGRSPTRVSRSPQTGVGHKSAPPSPKGKRSAKQLQRGYTDDGTTSQFVVAPNQMQYQQQRPQQVYFDKPTNMMQPFGRRFSDTFGGGGQKNAVAAIGDFVEGLKPLAQVIASAVLFVMIVFFIILIMMEVFTSNVLFRTATTCCR